LICDSKTAKTKELKIKNKNKNDDEPNPAAKPQSKVSRTTPMPEGDVLRGERRGLTEGVRSSAAPTPIENWERIARTTTEARRRADEHEMPSNPILCHWAS
jgi:hypothetical protein